MIVIIGVELSAKHFLSRRHKEVEEEDLEMFLLEIDVADLRLSRLRLLFLAMESSAETYTLINVLEVDHD